VVVAVVLALNYIHVQKRIIHRDLTPGNIVLGQGAAGLRHTKIADFGLAKCLSTGSITRSVVGTMPYTCPEIIQQVGGTCPAPALIIQKMGGSCQALARGSSSRWVAPAQHLP
jgi:serine/threonine protein kinase